jgi:tRNA dimethylallyltransferase
MNRNFAKKPKVIAVAGPTASGKTAYAVELARQINGEIISADSRLVYKGFDIGAAKPFEAERGGIAHHMLDLVEPDFDYSAGLYEQGARAAIFDIIVRGKVPIVAGGTGLYFRVLLENYDLPKFEPDYGLRKELQELSNLQLHDRLRRLDEDAALEIRASDRKKLIRAVEISETGAARSLKEPEFDVEWVGLNFARNELYERIEKRVDVMLEQGLIDETRGLLERYGRIRNIVETIGYREMTDYLDGRVTLDEAVKTLRQNTRNYAKRQLTWFRKNPEIKWNVYPERY